MPPFVPGVELARAFHAEAVAPLLAGRPHAAALLGWGSDVLGYDTERSTDHGWGPRLLVLVSDDDVEAVRAAVDAGLPERFRGWPVRYGWDGSDVVHHVEVTTLPRWLIEQLGVDASSGMTTLDWLLTPQQQLLGVVSGAVYADPSGALGAVRERLAWYPDEVWRWLLACQWRRIAQEEAFVARTAEVGDETGSAVTAARLVRDLMRLALLLARRYAPYQKWLGTAFARVPHADDLPGLLHRAVDGGDREEALAGAYVALARRQNALGVASEVEPVVGPYHFRPARVLLADRFADALVETLTDPWLRGLPLIGSVDQVADSTDLLSDPARCRRLAGLYE